MTHFLKRPSVSQETHTKVHLDSTIDFRGEKVKVTGLILVMYWQCFDIIVDWFELVRFWCSKVNVTSQNTFLTDTHADYDNFTLTKTELREK